MDGTARIALIIESDFEALAQMKRVLAGMEIQGVGAPDMESVLAVAGELVRNGTPPAVIVSRVTLPDGNGIQALDQLAELFPHARQVLVSHFAKNLLFTLPGFGDRQAEFLQAEFTDEQFRKVIERSMARTRSA